MAIQIAIPLLSYVSRIQYYSINIIVSTPKIIFKKLLLIQGGILFFLNNSRSLRYVLTWHYLSFLQQFTTTQDILHLHVSSLIFAIPTWHFS
jgi:hypothetical protein